MKCLCIALTVLISAGLGLPGVAHGQAGQAEPFVVYAAPSVAPIIDHFRPPAHVGGAGNRGLQFAPDGAAVAAAADGSVYFAGEIAGQFYITLSHADGLRSTYSFLQEVWVVQGQQVTAGLGIGLAGPAGLHFGVYAASHYLDPEVLLEASEPTQRVMLVPPP